MDDQAEAATLITLLREAQAIARRLQEGTLSYLITCALMEADHCFHTNSGETDGA